MKIGMILDQPFPPDSRVENEAVSLISKGFDVSLFALNFKDQKAYEEINKIKVYRYNFKKFLFKKLSPLAYSFPFYHRMLKLSIKEYVEKNQIDIIHIHDMVIAQVVFDLNKKWKLPIVLDLHENRYEIMKAYTHINSGIGRILVNLESWKNKQKEFVEKADNIILVTKEAKVDYLKENNVKAENIYVVPNTVDLNIFLKYKIENTIIEKYKTDFVVLYLGATGIRRGIDTAIQSVNLLKKKIPNVKLVLVGNSRDDDKLKKLAKDSGLENEVVFEGWQDVKLFPSFIKASQICISPLVRNRHHDTTYANKLFQYMSMGKPVVVSNCTAQENVVIETGCGLVHNADEEKDLAEKILQLYEKENLRIEMGKKGKSAVIEKYNWEKTGRSLSELYSNFSILLKKTASS